MRKIITILCVVWALAFMPGVSAAQAAPASNQEVWEVNGMRRPSHEEFEAFLRNSIESEHSDFFDDFKLTIYDISGPTRMPEIRIHIDVTEDVHDTFSEIEPFYEEDGAGFVVRHAAAFFTAQELDASEIEISANFRVGGDDIGFAFYADGSVQWVSYETQATPSQQQAQAPARQPQIYVEAVSGARIISQPNAQGFFEFERICCSNPRWGGAGRTQRMGALVGPFGANSMQCTSCKKFNSARFRGVMR